MDWNQLISDKRIHGASKASHSAFDPRSEYDRDVNRIFFSFPFRRLQNKTQVVPVPVFDFIHTRLTHSLEVATVGTLLGRMVGTEVLARVESKELKRRKLTEQDFGSIVRAACLAHDIGNPPFGHSGESAISDYFLNQTNFLQLGSLFVDVPGSFGKRIEALNEKHWSDFKNFEGNAMGFRIINNPKYRGFNLTYATLAAFTKYPRESLLEKKMVDPVLGGNLLKKDRRVSQKKYGFFQCDKEKFAGIAKELGLVNLGDSKYSTWCRHPLAFLMEAADDICYNLIDLEDGYRLGVIPFKRAEKLLKHLAGDKANSKVYGKLYRKEQIGYLRGKALYPLSEQVFKVFLANEKDILAGIFDKSLMHAIGDFKHIKEIKKEIETNVYTYTPILRLEAVGSEVLQGLLDIFITAVLADYLPGMSKKGPYHQEKIISLLPGEFCVKRTAQMEEGEEIYYKILNIIDYIAGMTDNYAIQLYRELKGIEIPHIQNIGPIIVN